MNASTLILNWHSVCTHSALGFMAPFGSSFGDDRVDDPWPSSFGSYVRSHSAGSPESFFSPRLW